VPPNTGDGSLSPLHQAVFSGDPRFVRMLLEKGANPNARDSAGETPLHEALRRRNYEMVGALLDFGANPNLPDRSGRTPLQAAGGDGFLMRKLLEKGAH
jgi:cytohesin